MQDNKKHSATLRERNAVPCQGEFSVDFIVRVFLLASGLKERGGFGSIRGQDFEVENGPGYSASVNL
jgi:hypothetical protein